MTYTTKEWNAIRDAAAVLDGVPEERFYPGLHLFSNFEQFFCGTLACGVGWLRFKEHGNMWARAYIERFLSVRYWPSLFAGRSHSNYDASVPDPECSDKDLLRWRFICFLREHGQSVSAEYARGW